MHVCATDPPCGCRAQTMQASQLRFVIHHTHCTLCTAHRHTHADACEGLLRLVELLCSVSSMHAVDTSRHTRIHRPLPALGHLSPMLHGGSSLQPRCCQPISSKQDQSGLYWCTSWANTHNCSYFTNMTAPHMFMPSSIRLAWL